MTLEGSREVFLQLGVQFFSIYRREEETLCDRHARSPMLEPAVLLKLCLNFRVGQLPTVHHGHADYCG